MSTKKGKKKRKEETRKKECMRERINELQGKNKKVSIVELQSNWLSSFHSHLKY
jgi:hypothetical protein